jgi:chromosomal replication initiator protein
MTQKNPICPYVFPGLKLDEIDSKNNPFIKTIKRRITEDELFEIIKNESGFTKENLKSSSRKRELVDMRQLISFVLKTDFNRTLSSIGKTLGDRDHTTILHSIRKFYDLYETNTSYKNTCNNILESVGIKTDNIV